MLSAEMVAYGCKLITLLAKIAILSFQLLDGIVLLIKPLVDSPHKSGDVGRIVRAATVDTIRSYWPVRGLRRVFRFRARSFRWGTSDYARLQHFLCVGLLVVIVVLFTASFGLAWLVKAPVDGYAAFHGDAPSHGMNSDDGTCSGRFTTPQKLSSQASIIISAKFDLERQERRIHGCSGKEGSKLPIRGVWSCLDYKELLLQDILLAMLLHSELESEACNATMQKITCAFHFRKVQFVFLPHHLYRGHKALHRTSNIHKIAFLNQKVRHKFCLNEFTQALLFHRQVYVVRRLLICDR